MPLTLSINPGLHIPRPLTLQRLPQEIQLRIYEFTVIEPLRWDRRHTLGCEWKPSNTQEMEAPPFVLTEIRIDTKASPWWPVTTSRCRCGKRQSLGLLLACKSINAMASPIFWSQNTFCFIKAIDFIVCVGRNLRPTCRDEIRSVSVINQDITGDLKYVRGSYSDGKQMLTFWRTLKSCKALRTLEMCPAYIQPNSWVATHEQLNALLETLPNFSVLRLTYLLPLGPAYTGRWGYTHPSYCREEHQLVYVKCSRSIPLLPEEEETWTADLLKNVFNDMHFNFRIYIDTAVKVKFFGADIDNLEEYKSSWRIVMGLDETSPVRRLTLPNGETTVIKIYGLPITAETRNARVKHIMTEKRKKQFREDGSNAAEHEAMKLGQQRRREGRESEMTKESVEHQDDILARGVRRLELHASENESAKKSVKKQKAKVRNAMKAADENRRLERKRQGPSRAASS